MNEPATKLKHGRAVLTTHPPCSGMDGGEMPCLSLTLYHLQHTRELEHLPSGTLREVDPALSLDSSAELVWWLKVSLTHSQCWEQGLAVPITHLTCFGMGRGVIFCPQPHPAPINT